MDPDMRIQGKHLVFKFQVYNIVINTDFCKKTFVYLGDTETHTRAS